MGCHGSKSTAPSRPAKQQAAKATLLQEPVVESKVAKLELGVPEEAILPKKANSSEEPLANSPREAVNDVQQRLRESLDKALHNGSLAAAATTVAMGDQDVIAEVLPVTEEFIVEEVAPAPASKFPWNCMCTACA